MSLPLSHGRLGLADAEQEARLLGRIIETISQGLDLDGMAQGVADLIIELTATDVCFVHLLDDTGRQLKLRGATPPFSREAGNVELLVGEGVAGWVAAHREAAVVPDKFADPRYKYIPALHGEDYVSLVSVPIITLTDVLVGVLNVHTRRRREFTEEDVRLLRSVANLMAGAIENARLHRGLADREEALGRFAEQMVALQEAERRRLAGEIHDGIGQRIVSLSFHLSAAGDLVGSDAELAAEQIDKARRLAAEALDEVRSAMAGLRPPVLDDLGLGASLSSLAHDCPGLVLDVDVQALSRPLPEHAETAIYRIAQEALQNVLKHAEASRARIELRERRDGVLLEISDDGVGFDPQRMPDTRGPSGHGLSGMRQRAELLGGWLEIDTAVGAGTTLRLGVPLMPG